VREHVSFPRPHVRGDCIDGPRPCPWVSCVHHLYLEVDSETGALKLNFPDHEPWELPETCSLDVADEGEHNVDQVGQLLNLTGRRVKQIENQAIARAAANTPRPMMSAGELMTRTEAMQRLGCSDGLLTKLAQQARLHRCMDPKTKRWRYSRADVEREHKERTRLARERLRRLTRTGG
jgi:hypothetical protein